MKRTSLRRKTWMRSRRRTPRRATRVRNAAYMAWIRTQDCAAEGLSDCFGDIEADHAGRRGYGQKSDDTTCIPLCLRHHEQRGAFSGPFRYWTQDHMRRWLSATVQWFNHAYAQIPGGTP